MVRGRAAFTFESSGLFLVEVGLNFGGVFIWSARRGAGSGARG